MAEFRFEDEDLATLKGKVVLITGGSSGIGLATVELLLSIGAMVAIGDLQPPGQQMKGTFTFVKTDVTRWDDLLALFDKTKELYGRIDHVFANAGIGPRADYLSLELDQDGKLMEPSSQSLDTNLKGVINTSALAIHHMHQQEYGGSIVITGSATGLPAIPSRRLCCPILEGFADDINVDAQPAYVVARCACYLMSDTSMNGQHVHVQRGKYVEVDDAVLLPAYDKINGDGCPSEDEAFERLVAPAA
ncbi:hypothetical protein FPOA_13977 [Fusarium poae]|uniref:Uncharacterized protein n=1 Tax=Fusarium poae TaxID=36050 RepID=A0A1B8A3T0_FUSPO|nr:hypothetical protein FPOA_13977 [Fusarium poae]